MPLFSRPCLRRARIKVRVPSSVAGCSRQRSEILLITSILLLLRILAALLIREYRAARRRHQPHY